MRAKSFFQPGLSFWGLAGAAIALVCATTLAGFAGRLWWIFDLCSHFRVQYLLALIFAAVLFATGRKKVMLIVCLLFAFINLALILPLYFGPGSKPPPSAKILRVFMANVHTANQQFEKILTEIDDAKPDVVILLEIDQSWLNDISTLTNNYPVVAKCPRDDNFGIAMYAKNSDTQCIIEYFGEADVPSVMAHLALGGRELTLIGTHPLPPGGREYTQLRNQQLEEMADYVRGLKNPVIVTGDLNITPWCWMFRKFVRLSGLLDSERGWGLQPTWPAMNKLMYIPLDHAFHSPDLVVVNRRVGKDTGSDHYPLIVDFAWANY